MNPQLIDARYPINRIHHLAKRIGIVHDEPIGVAALVTVPRPPGRPTVNMLAPIVIGARSRVGVQVVLHGSRFGLRHAL
ncbi:MAG: flagellar assembly protein FliW [Myxococcales bacterium]|nr:flagellar assembly protein FliW [Myxococcales bacterium]